MASTTTSPNPTLLTIPIEIRLKIFSFLLTSTPILVETRPSPSTIFSSSASNPFAFSTDTPARLVMNPTPLSSQLLRVNKQIYTETLPLLYSTNTFDCHMRSGIDLLLTTLTPSNFTLITSLTLDWDQLQDFSFSLAKPSFTALTSSLSVINLAHWRTRVLLGKSFMWNDVKAYERTLCQSAYAIVTKSAKLRLLAQRPWVRPSQSLQSTANHFNPANAIKAAQVDDQMKSKLQASSSIRIKWRFLADSSQLLKEETVVDLERELALLFAGGVAKDEGPVQSALDPM